MCNKRSRNTNTPHIAHRIGGPGGVSRRFLDSAPSHTTFLHSNVHVCSLVGSSHSSSSTATSPSPQIV